VSINALKSSVLAPEAAKMATGVVVAVAVHVDVVVVVVEVVLVGPVVVVVLVCSPPSPSPPPEKSPLKKETILSRTRTDGTPR
jgi:hypothetical protein